MSTLRDDLKPVTIDIEISSSIVAVYGVKGAIERALVPWIGKSLIASGRVHIWLNRPGGAERVIVRRNTRLAEILDATAVEILLAVDMPLPEVALGQSEGRSTRPELTEARKCGELAALTDEYYE